MVIGSRCADVKVAAALVAVPVTTFINVSSSISLIVGVVDVVVVVVVFDDVDVVGMLFNVLWFGVCTFA